VLYADHALLHALLKQTTRRGAGDISAPRHFVTPVGRFLRGTEACADSGIPLGGAHYLRRRGSQERYGQRCTDAPGAILQAWEKQWPYISIPTVLAAKRPTAFNTLHSPSADDTARRHLPL